MDDIESSFHKIFSRMLKDSIRRDPGILLTYMEGSGLRGPMMEMMTLLIEEDHELFLESVTSPEADLGGIVEMLSTEHGLDGEILGGVLSVIRSTLIDASETRLVDHPDFGRCRITMDETVIYNDDLTELIHVYGDITSFIVPESIQRIRDRAFEDCRSLSEVMIPDGIRFIGEGAFKGCLYVNMFIGDNGVSSNGRYKVIDGCLYEFTDCFGNNGKLLVGYNLARARVCAIPCWVDSIGEFAFGGCSFLEEISIPDSVISMGRGAFHMCEQLRKVTLSGSLSGIPPYAFAGCEYLEGISIPNSVTIIGQAAFEGCIGLRNVTIGGPVYSIGDVAFDRCMLLRSMIIPGTVSEIGEMAFGYCPEISVSIGSADVSDDGRYMTKDGCLYRSSSCSGTYDELLVGYGLVENGRCTIPDTVRIIGHCAFSNCDSLEEVTIPHSVTVIDTNAFAHCSSLVKVDIPDSVTIIGDGAFLGCRSLSRVVVPDSVKSIGQYGFADSSIEGIVIPESVEEVGERAFEECKKLSKVVLPRSITRISDSTFVGCGSLTEITIPDSVTYIGFAAFDYCISLEEVVIPDSVEFIGEWAFADCWSLERAVIPEGLSIENVFPANTEVVRSPRAHR